MTFAVYISGDPAFEHSRRTLVKASVILRNDSGVVTGGVDAVSCFPHRLSSVSSIVQILVSQVVQPAGLVPLDSLPAGPPAPSLQSKLNAIEVAAEVLRDTACLDHIGYPYVAQHREKRWPDTA